MPDLSQNNPNLPPPSGDSARAEKYISQLIKLVNQNKLLVNHTDLAQFDPSSIEDHYRMELKEYHVEISHSKQPDSGKDFYIMLFTNLQDIRDGCSEKIILAYLYITGEQFTRFKNAADEKIEIKRKIEEEKRFQIAMAPVDDVLKKMDSSESLLEEIQEVAQEEPPIKNTIPVAAVSQVPTAPLSDTTPQNTLGDFSSIINDGQTDNIGEFGASVDTANIPPQTIEVPPLPADNNLTAPQTPLGDNKSVVDLLNEFSQQYQQPEQPQPPAPPTT